MRRRFVRGGGRVALPPGAAPASAPGLQSPRPARPTDNAEMTIRPSGPRLLEFVVCLACFIVDLLPDLYGERAETVHATAGSACTATPATTRPTPATSSHDGT